MSTQEAGELCRITVVGLKKAVDVALPTYVVLAQLQSELLRLAGEELTKSGSETGGWVLQRLGEEPLDEDLTSKVLGLRDGDTIYLRPRDSQLPLADFDDIADGVATAVRGRPDRWASEHTATATLTVAAVATTVGLGLLLAPGTPLVRAAVAALLAVALGVAGVITTRILARSRAGAVLAVCCVAAAALAGFLVVDAEPGPPGPALVAGATTAIGAVFLLAVALPPVRRVAVGAAAATLLAGLATVIATLFELTTSGLCAVAAILAIAVLGMLPRIAAWTARLRIPALPSSIEQLLENTELEPTGRVMERTVVADRHVTDLTMGVGVLAAGALGVLGTADGWSIRTCAAAGALALVLHARAFTGVWPRLALMGAALVGVVSLVVDAASGWSWPARSGLAVALVLPAVGVAPVADLLAGRRLMPRWGWFGDLLQTLATLSMLPLAAGEWGLYTWALSLGG